MDNLQAHLPYAETQLILLKFMSAVREGVFAIVLYNLVHTRGVKQYTAVIVSGLDSVKHSDTYDKCDYVSTGGCFAIVIYSTVHIQGVEKPQL